MSRPPRVIWAYTYRLLPPLAPARLRAVRALLAHERRLAATQAAVWEGRLVADDRLSHILVLSDTPELDQAANGRLEAALRAIGAGFAVTVPLAVSATPTPRKVPRKQ